MVRTIVESNLKKLTVIKGHTPSNNYDGYDPHRHWELFNMPVSDYLEKVVKQRDRIFPPADMKDLVLSPWQVPWIRENVQKVGYDFLQKADPIHKDLYAFGSIHDGVDGQHLLEGGPGVFVKTVRSVYHNKAGYNATADIYEIQMDSVLELWEAQLGFAALEEFNRLDLVQDLMKWKKTLEQPVEQWLFWEILLRFMKKYMK